MNYEFMVIKKCAPLSLTLINTYVSFEFINIHDNDKLLQSHHSSMHLKMQMILT